MPVSAGLSDGDIRAALATLAGGWLTMGPRIAELEERFAAALGVPHAVAVSSGYAALHLACLAAGAGPGRSVVVSALAPPEAVAAARACWAQPLRADVLDPLAPGLDLSAADGSTVAVVASHLAGIPAELPAPHAGRLLIEDATSALGARLADGRPAGTAGALGCFSLAEGNVIGVGEGGMVVTGDDRLAARVRSLRSHAMTSVTWERHRGHADTYDIVDIGFNHRLDEPRAAIALSQLERLDERVEARRGALREILAEVPSARLLGGEDAFARSAPSAAPLSVAEPALRDALAPLARSWPDAFAGMPAARPAPLAAELRRHSLLLELDPAAVAGLTRPG